MGRDEIAEMKRLAAKARKRAAEYRKTPEGRELDLKMAFAMNILRALKAKRLTQAEFCRRIVMKSSQFSRIIQGEENVTLDMVTRIARGLGLYPQVAFRRKSPQAREAVELAGADKQYL